ncbi:MAG: DUF4290 domain-containing protein [Alistipes sp.]|nr:DUF4290 domain-containing protein [Alistipes sp.]
MRKNYNYTRRKLFLPEYGRHIQEMVDSLLDIEDRRERTRQAKAVIAVMGNLNPLLRDTADFTHKLWDHLIIMSDFKLDVDSPYPLPTRQDLTVVPGKLAYPQSHVSHKHYGKYIGRMIRRIGEAAAGTDTVQEVDNVARFMHMKSFEYNQEHPNHEVIAKDIREMSGNAIELDEETLNNLRNDYKQHFSQRQQPGRQNNRKAAKSGQKNNRNQQQRQQRQQKNNGTKHNPAR